MKSEASILKYMTESIFELVESTCKQFSCMEEKVAYFKRCPCRLIFGLANK